MSTAASTTTPTLTRRNHPLRSLAKAEYLQFRRNTTLMAMGVGFPVAIPLVPFFIALRDGEPTAFLVSTTLEIFALMAMLFVQYYSVLSMVTTRRGEGVLKRLRTGEASDWQIQMAPMVPGAVLTLVGTVLISAVVYGAGSPAPVNPVAIGLGVIAGVVVFSLLALATTTFTKNAEAAQITSLPLMALSMMGMAPLRQLLPDRLAEIAEWTPFAAISDLMFIGSSGTLATAGEGAAAMDMSATFAEIGQPLATLAIWSLVAFALARQYFRWDDRG